MKNDEECNDNQKILKNEVYDRPQLSKNFF
jgi:hypothetical protein